ncbi:osmotically-inducible lipoprotein OsmE [Pseudomonas vancouverensis]|uniref:Osmotically-inducible lipoprotein OsmE n=1 Tax=Pseudomonas vancouverensis TaxID=95300 RepID=A0A1H2MZH7_PSEVA|nr:osmotically-inducible lipoprotein OsmE [Pseudomonas vancouverensis]KAB0495638.1 osmotically-inducible lipoprotein OsmE [Pseudomonas vancouverensis]TDB65441.1 osmotically-inducible lipoprotein OsmE [Pseudomonas vancouverensis]SDU98261.1 Beta-barrel assembly machine subunit BamE [Pseudomonas vancouverensis]
MNRPVYIVVLALTALAGCSATSMYDNQPLVAKVDEGMTKEQVQQIGGPPLAISTRTAVPGTCFDYKLTQDGHQQNFNVSFDNRGLVDHTSFLSCPEWSRIQEKEMHPSHHASGGGY